MSSTMFLGRVVLPADRPVAGGRPDLASGAERDCRGSTRDDSAGAARPNRPPRTRSRLRRLPGRITAEGRVVAYPGAEVTVGTEVLGTIVNMPVREKSAVHKGDLLVELRSDEVRASLREAQHRPDRGRGRTPLRAGAAPRELLLPSFANGATRRAPRHAARRSPAAMRPRRPSSAWRPSWPSTASSRRSTAWSSPATPTPAKRSVPPRRW